MSVSTVKSDLHVQGNLTAKQFTPPTNCIGNAAIDASSPLDDTKSYRVHNPAYAQDGGSDVADGDALLHIVKGTTAEILKGRIGIDTAPDTSSGKQYTVDIQRSTAGGAFASILSGGAVTVDDSDTDRSVVQFTFSTTSLVQDDMLKVVITTSGASGNQGQGVLVSLEVAETPV